MRSRDARGAPAGARHPGEQLVGERCGVDGVGTEAPWSARIASVAQTAVSCARNPSGPSVGDAAGGVNGRAEVIGWSMVSAVVRLFCSGLRGVPSLPLRLLMDEARAIYDAAS